MYYVFYTLCKYPMYDNMYYRIELCKELWIFKEYGTFSQPLFSFLQVCSNK